MHRILLTKWFLPALAVAAFIGKTKYGLYGFSSGR
jgi:hypothetical protein